MNLATVPKWAKIIGTGIILYFCLGALVVAFFAALNALWAPRGFWGIGTISMMTSVVLLEIFVAVRTWIRVKINI